MKQDMSPVLWFDYLDWSETLNQQAVLSSVPLVGDATAPGSETCLDLMMTWLVLTALTLNKSFLEIKCLSFATWCTSSRIMSTPKPKINWGDSD